MQKVVMPALLRTNISIVAFFLAIFISYSAFAEKEQKQSKKPPLFNYSEFTIDNGLRVIVLPNHRLPIVTQNLIYLVGAADEQPGEHGVAHYLEHLLFQGTKKFPKGEFDRFIARNGGNHNAFTFQDMTVYTANIPKSALPKLMELEADRMVNLDVVDNDIARERAVVMEEFKTRINRPEFKYGREIDLSLYPDHPYGRDIIGTEEEINGFNSEKAMTFYKKHYAPDAAVLVLAGDVSVEEARDLVTKTFGGVTRKTGDRRLAKPSMPVPSRNRVEKQHERAANTSVERYYLLPALGKMSDKEAAAFQFFMDIVGNAANGILSRKLVREQQVAVSAGGSFQNMKHGSLLSVSVSAAPGVTAEILEQKLGWELKNIYEKGIDEEEFREQKHRIIAQRTYLADDHAGLAWSVTYHIGIGLNPSWIIRFEDVVDDLSREDVNRIATTFLKSGTFVNGVFQPSIIKRASGE